MFFIMFLHVFSLSSCERGWEEYFSSSACGVLVSSVEYTHVIQPEKKNKESQNYNTNIIAISFNIKDQNLVFWGWRVVC